MSAQDVVEHFIEPMKVIFGDPPGDNPEAALRVYLKPLSRFSPEILAKTAEHFQITSKRRTWPLPAAVIDFAVDLSSRCRADKRVVTAAETERRREKIASEAVFSDLGVRAAREGWIVGLSDFARDNFRKPDETEIAEIKSRLDASYASMESVLDETDGQSALPGLKSIARKMLKRRSKMAGEVLAWAEAR